MPKPAIVVENLSKVYRIGHRERRADTLVGSVVGALAAPVRNFRNLYRLGSAGRDGDDSDTLRAIDDVSFEVPQGEVLGVIGRNGAGKSTLLKILSRVTRPTSGRIRMRGRVSSLLEVGTGFHPELTGRENVYLNGTILGMTKREIDRKFDEIVDFSGVERFLDTPVKRYSSGMKVRLAFAVAAHLDPEILIIDEVLAVGDAEFQSKCLGKMRQIAGGQGRTVLFVSHNLGSVVELCDRCILLDQGKIARDDNPQGVVAFYTRSRHAMGAVLDLSHWTGDRSGDGSMRVASIAMLDAEGAQCTTFGYRESIRFVIKLTGPSCSRFSMAISVRTELGVLVLHHSTLDDGVDAILGESGAEVKFYIPDNLLSDGRYYLTVWLGDARNTLQDRVGDCLSFDVDTSAAGHTRTRGLIRLPASWDVRAT
jgi:lipopolysaccharide transport system ATP-binding protein